MNSWPRHEERAGFSLIELAVVVVIIALVAGLVLPSFINAKARAQRIRCTSHLKQIGLASRQWALGSANAYPMSTSITNGGTQEMIATGEVWPHFQVMSNELNTPVVLKCPADGERKARTAFGPNLSNTNISYFVGLDANDTMPQMFLSGDRNIVGATLQPNRILLVTTNDAVSWGKDLHKFQGNVALADGSVQGFSSSRLQAALANSGVETNRLAMP